MNSISSPRRSFRRGRLLANAAALFVLLFLFANVTAQEEPLPDINGIPQGSDSPDFNGIVQSPSSSRNSPAEYSSENSLDEYKGMPNIVLAEKKGIRAYGWGEYNVGGRCLCCDNSLDGDCIIVQSTNRTDKMRIKQVIDGKIEADTGDKATYFGDVEERENPVPVSLLMTEITLKKMADIYKVTVYTMIDEEKKKNFLSNCELGYYDRFERLQWVGKVGSKWTEDHVSFVMEKPIYTKSILLKVKGGKNRITEVALFGTVYKE